MNGAGNLDITNGTKFTGNSVGAIYFSGDDVSITGIDAAHPILFDSNELNGSMINLSSVSGDLNINHAAITNNTLTNGLYIYNRKSNATHTINDLKINNNTFNNSNTTVGLEVYFNDKGQVTISNSEIKNNTFAGSANGSGPIYAHVYNSVNGKLILDNVTIENNETTAETGSGTIIRVQYTAVPLIKFDNKR